MTIDVPLRAESWGPTTVSLLHQTVGENFSRQVKRSPDRIAIIAGTRRVSYQELDELSDALAQGFLTLGLRRSDRVAVSLGNCIEYGVILYACLKIGTIVVPLNPAYTLAQLASALDHVSASLLVLSTEITLPYRNPKATAPLVSQLLDHISPSSSLQHLLLLDNSDGRSDIPFFESTVDYEVLLEQHLGTKLLQQHGLDAGNVATIQFTSGTTSKPKAVCLTHRNILNNACLVGQGMCLTENDVICCPPPLYHCFGLVLGLLAAMTHGESFPPSSPEEEVSFLISIGASLLFPSESFNAEATLKAIVQHSATALYGVPTMFLAELELISKGLFTASNFGTLRTGVIGGSPIPPALRLQLHEKMNLSGLTNCYGLTESSPIVVQTDVHDTLDTKMSSVGRVLPHSAIRIAARDNPCQTLYRGEKGEIQIAGYAVMHGYWESEEETRKAVIQVGDTSWLRTGDEGLMASDGTIQITGRIKDIIIRGGENIYPAEIEDCLLKHEQVSCASVVGLPDPRYGETIAAFIQHREGVTVCIGDHDKDFSADLRATATVSSTTSTLTAGQIRDWVRDTLGKSLVPRHVFWVSSMPLTTSGKIEKFRLQEMGVIHLNSRR